MASEMSPRPAALFTFVCALGLATATTANARSVRDEPYPSDVTWNAAVRLVRVDFGFAITERDHDLGYFTFQWREGRRTVPGSVELVNTTVDGRTGTRVIVQIPQMPTYVESMLLARLGRKLRQEFGEPPAPRPQEPSERTPNDSRDSRDSRDSHNNTDSRPSGSAPSHTPPSSGSSDSSPPNDLSPSRNNRPVDPAGTPYDSTPRRRTPPSSDD